MLWSIFRLSKIAEKLHSDPQHQQQLLDHQFGPFFGWNATFCCRFKLFERSFFSKQFFAFMSQSDAKFSYVDKNSFSLVHSFFGKQSSFNFCIWKLSISRILWICFISEWSSISTRSTMWCISVSCKIDIISGIR